MGTPTNAIRHEGPFRVRGCPLCSALQLQLPDGRLVSYGGFYSLWGEPNPWVGETGVQAFCQKWGCERDGSTTTCSICRSLAEYITYNAATGTAAVVSNVDPWLQSIGWCGGLVPTVAG
jgi:hypothetical protein